MSEPLVAGAVIGGDFRVVRELQIGGMGAVYVAEQLSTGKQRALKVMHPELLANDKQQDRFVQEAKVGAKIDSEHVVEVIAAGIDDGRPWLAMELLDGKDLADMLEEKGKLGVAETLEILAQVGHALGAAHAAGIVHRDLKPENVFISRARQKGVALKVKVLDFGIAKVVADARATSGGTAAIGTPLWMAPEQCQKGGRICAATDVWPLGLIAFRMLSGKCYWREAQGELSLMEVMREILFDPIEPASVRDAAVGGEPLPPGFDAWFARCIEREPEKRFADASEAVAALEKALEPPSDVAVAKTVELPIVEPRPKTPSKTQPMSPVDLALNAPPLASRTPPRSGPVVRFSLVIAIAAGMALIAGYAAFRSSSEDDGATRHEASAASAASVVHAVDARATASIAIEPSASAALAATSASAATSAHPKPPASAAPSSPAPGSPAPNNPAPSNPAPSAKPSAQPSENPINSEKAALLAKMHAGTASINELRMLKSICAAEGDHACASAASRRLHHRQADDPYE